MIKLRVVGYSDDLKNLILSSKKQGRRGSHITPIDDKMFDVLEEVWRERRSQERGEKKAARAASVPAESKLPPREVQRLLRSGRSPHDVAEMAGVDVEWVERFSGPVIQEKSGVIARVQDMWFEKPKLGRSGAPLGEAVATNLRSRHVRLSEDQIADSWDATRVDSQPWVISLEFSFRGRRQRAVWRFDPHARSLVAGNRLAADLGWVKSAKRRSESVAPSRSASRPTAKKAAKRPAKKKAAGRPAKKKAVKRPAKKRATTRRPASQRAPAKRRPAKKAARRATSARRAGAKRPAAKKRSGRTKAATRRAPVKRRPAPKKKSSSRSRTTARRPARRR